MRSVLVALVIPFLLQDKPTWAQLVERGMQNVERLKDLKAAIPREGYDPAALAKSLGGDPAKAAEFVRTHIAFEPVRGFERGAQGALVSRSAGWADRALLLAALLQDKSPVLVRGIRPAGPAPAFGGASAVVGEASIADVASRLKLDPKRLANKARDAEVAAADAWKSLWLRVDRDLAAVAAALQSAGVAPPAEVAAAPEEVWWVRIGDKDLERPQGSEEKGVVALAELPVEETHRLTIRMKIFQGDEETVVLDVSFRTMDVFGRVLTLTNAPGDDPRKLHNFQAKKPAGHVDALATTGIFVPLLTGGDKAVSGHPFDLSGNKVQVKNGTIQKLAGALDVFDALPGGVEKKKELTGALLEIVLSVPGAEPSTSVREILRKGVKGRQRVFDLFAVREILVLPGELRGDFALDRLLDADIAVKTAVLAKIQPKALVVDKRPERLNAKLYQFALARSAAAAKLRAKLKATSSGGTALVSFVHRIRDGKPATIRAGFDILLNPAANLAAPPDWASNPAFAGGILDTALERELHAAKGSHSNASALLEQSLAAKTPLKVEKEGERLRVVVPGKPRAWYEIDAKTGGCLGFTEEGGGQDMAEYATLLADKLEEIREWQSQAELLNSILECAMNAIDAGDPTGSFGRCVTGVAIGEAFGWAAGGIIGGAAGDNPFARLGGMGLEDALNDAFSDAMDSAMGGR